MLVIYSETDRFCNTHFIQFAFLVLWQYYYLLSYSSSQFSISRSQLWGTNNCFFFVLQSFFGGPADTRDFFDIALGVIVVIILLNVVIAIVSEAWSEAMKTSKQVSIVSTS